MLWIWDYGIGDMSSVWEKEIVMEIISRYDDLPIANMGLDGVVVKGDEKVAKELINELWVIWVSKRWEWAEWCEWNDKK